MTREEISDWYERYGVAVHRRCVQLLGNDADASDATQDVFLNAYRHRDSFRGEASPLTWLCSIAYRRCLDLLDKRRHAGNVASLPADSSTAHVDSVLARNELGRLVSRFDRKTQMIVILYYVDELDQTEIARQLKCSRRTVINKLNRFRERAGRIMREWRQ